MKSQNIFILLVVSIVEIIQIINAEKRLHFQVKDITAWSDNAYLNFTHKIDQTLPAAEFVWKVLKPMPDIDFEFGANIWTKENHNHYGNVNGSYSVCQILALKNASPIAMLVFAHIKTFAAIPESCPIQKDTYSVKKMWPEDLPARLKLPEIEVKTEIRAFALENDQRISILEMKIHAEAIYSEVTGNALQRGASGLLSVLSG